MNKPNEYLQEKIDSYTKTHKGEDPEKILAYMRVNGFITDDDLDGSIDPEIQKVINENFFDMLDGEAKETLNNDALEKAATLYRKYREECGCQDPIALNEIENAFYEGGLRQEVRDRYKCGHVIEGTYDCDDETSWICFDGWILSTSELGKKIKVIIVKEG